MSLKQSKLRRSEPQVEVVSSCGPGPRLRDARLARSLQIPQAAELLKLDAAILVALEQDDYSQLPEPLYVRGYLGSYARLLGIPEGEVLSDYRAMVGETSAPNLNMERSVRPQARSTDASVRSFSYLVIVMVFGLVGWWSYEYLREETPNSVFVEPVDTSVPAVGPALATAPAAPRSSEPAGGAAGSEPIPPASPEPPAAETGSPAGQGAPDQIAATDSADVSGEGPIPEVELATQTPQADVETVAVVPVPTPPQPDADTAVVAALGPGMGRLELSFQRDCWLEVRDVTGERLAYGLAKAGSGRSLQGRLPFQITLGDSGAATLRLDGETVAPARYDATDGQPSRFTLEGGQAEG